MSIIWINTYKVFNKDKLLLFFQNFWERILFYPLHLIPVRFEFIDLFKECHSEARSGYVQSLPAPCLGAISWCPYSCASLLLAPLAPSLDLFPFLTLSTVCHYASHFLVHLLSLCFPPLEHKLPETGDLSGSLIHKPLNNCVECWVNKGLRSLSEPALVTVAVWWWMSL